MRLNSLPTAAVRPLSSVMSFHGACVSGTPMPKPLTKARTRALATACSDVSGKKAKASWVPGEEPAGVTPYAHSGFQAGRY